MEHDEEAIREADYVFDIGVGAGVYGGKVVAEGTPKEIIRNSKSITGQYLSGVKKINIPNVRREGNGKNIIIENATGNNLQGVRARG